MLSSVSQVPGEPILVVTLCQSITEPNSQLEYYALANRLSQMLRQVRGTATCVIDASRVDVGSVERIMALIDSLRGATRINPIVVLGKYPSGTMRVAVPVFSTVPRALDEARKAA